MFELDSRALDRHITGNYGEDQFRFSEDEIEDAYVEALKETTVEVTDSDPWLGLELTLARPSDEESRLHRPGTRPDKKNL